jgi:hypothetical protein
MVLSAISHPSTPIGQNWPTSHAQLLRFKHRHRLLTGGTRDHALLFGTRAVIVQNSFRWKKHLRYYCLSGSGRATIRNSSTR